MLSPWLAAIYAAYAAAIFAIVAFRRYADARFDYFRRHAMPSTTPIID